MSRKHLPADGAEPRNRVFKTSWFVKAARKAGISDKELCKALGEVQQGKCDDLGGGVFKKRLGKNAYRSIILAKGKRWWIYTYLFAKKDRENIDDAEFAAFRRLAEVYRLRSDEDIAVLVKAQELMEICHDGDKEAQVQE